MKTLTFLLVLVATSVPTFACPNLTGTYRSETYGSSSDGEVTLYEYSQNDCKEIKFKKYGLLANGQRVLEHQATYIIDGKPRVIEDKESKVLRNWVFTSTGVKMSQKVLDKKTDKEIATAEETYSLSSDAKKIETYFVYKDIEGNIEDEFSDLLAKTENEKQALKPNDGVERNTIEKTSLRQLSPVKQQVNNSSANQE